MPAAILMAIVALACAGGALYVARRTTHSEASVYRNRIAGTMLGAGAIILIAYAFALYSWNVAK